MRISDAMMSANYLENLNKSRAKLESIQKQMASQKKIQQPSDSPEGTTRVMNFQTKMSQNEIYQKNITDGITFIAESVNSLGQINDSIAEVLKTVVDSRNASLNESNLQGLGQKIDSIITSLLDYANSNYNGKYLFGGTDHTAPPFGYNSDNSAVEVKVGDISGDQNIRISENRIQNINLPGSDLFSTIITEAGNFNSASAVGDTSTTSTQIYDASGNAYTLNVSYQKTAANTYDMTYDILDGGGTTILAAPPAAKEFVFDSATGMLKTIDGNAPSKINIKSSANNIEFLLDATYIQEKNAAASISSSANQKTSIFNTLISLKNSLNNGIRPDAQQEADIQAFYDHLLNKESQIGNVQNQMENVQELLKQKSTNFQELIANEMEVDIPQLLIDLQNQEYVLQMSYKMASMVLPKSLMDYL